MMMSEYKRQISDKINSAKNETILWIVGIALLGFVWDIIS